MWLLKDRHVETIDLLLIIAQLALFWPGVILGGGQNTCA